MGEAEKIWKTAIAKKNPTKEASQHFGKLFEEYETLKKELDKKIPFEDKLVKVAKNSTFTANFNRTLNIGDLKNISAAKNSDNAEIKDNFYSSFRAVTKKPLR
jgi:hypothetical protein